MSYHFQIRMRHSKTCLKRPLKKKTTIGFQDRLLLNAGQKLQLVIKIFVLSIFEWPLKTGFTVHRLQIYNQLFIDSVCLNHILKVFSRIYS